LAASLIDSGLFAAVDLMPPAPTVFVELNQWPSLIGTGCFFLLAGINLWGILVHGQTIGKWLLKIAIVAQETNLPPGFMRAAVIRLGPQIVLLTLFPLAGLVYSVIDGLLIFSKTRQWLHDRLVRTVVIVGTRQWWQRKHQVDERAHPSRSRRRMGR
jgi:uncharacterized RDD family membrane protein YckC